MPVTQQQPIFTPEEAERFAKLWAGFDIGNASEAEAMGKCRALRRMLAGKTLDDGKALRLVDALELREIRQALDAQMQPARQPLADVAVLEEKLQNLEEQLSESLNNNQILTDALTRLQGRDGGGFTGSLLAGFLVLALAAECVVAVIGLFGGHTPPPHVSEAASITAAAPLKASSILPELKLNVTREQLVGKQQNRPHARPKLPVVVVPESKF